MITERKVAEAIRDGVLPSPQNFHNATMIAMRISGTGAAWRSKGGEFVWRDPGVWLTGEMIGRWYGAPVILLHPKGEILDGPEFVRRVIGAITLPYVKGDELWGIARILDDEAAVMLAEGNLDTSPAVLAAGKKIELPEGGTLLVEAPPELIDHLAIVPRGVWSKDGASAGVAA